VTTPDYSTITDTSRPRPVRIAAFVGFVAQALLSTLAIALKLDPALVGSILGVITVSTLVGWLMVEGKVTPTSSPAVERDGKLVALAPARQEPLGPFDGDGIA
jgi:hypothetical protein